LPTPPRPHCGRANLLRRSEISTPRSSLSRRYDFFRIARLICRWMNGASMSVVAGFEKGLMLPTGMAFTGISAREGLRREPHGKAAARLFGWAAAPRREYARVIGRHVPVAILLRASEIATAFSKSGKGCNSKFLDIRLRRLAIDGRLCG